MPSLKRALAFIVLAVLILPASGCLCYLANVSGEQMSILWNRRPIVEVIKDPKSSSDTKKKLGHILEVRQYARERLGLTPGGAYTSYTDIRRDHAAWNVSASQELALKPRTWWFPIVGSVPYLGFFTQKEAETLARELKEEGWDTLVRPVSAYSTLGWFDDPILSSQLNYNEWYLTGLVIHETAHATLWFADDVRFNESFASFVEEEGMMQYYREKEGAESASFKRKVAMLKERELVSAIYWKYARKLNDMYRSGIPVDEKRKQKEMLIAQFKQEFLDQADKFTVFDVRKYASAEYNNANFLTHLTYDSGKKFFRKAFALADRNWPKFLQEMGKLRTLTPKKRQELLNSSEKPEKK